MSIYGTLKDQNLEVVNEIKIVSGNGMRISIDGSGSTQIITDIPGYTNLRKEK